VRVGAKARRVRKFRSAGGGVRFRRTRRAVWVFVVRGRRVRAVAVTTRGLARHRRALRIAARRVLTAKASARKRVFVPSTTQARAAARGKPTGQPLAGTSDPRLNAALAMLCGLQVGGSGATAGAGR
jgi:hypothetical protein